MPRRAGSNRRYTYEFEIRVIKNRAYFLGTFPVEEIRKLTSYYVQGYLFSPAYKQWIVDAETGQRRRAWDGKVHLFDKKSESMPPGLIDGVLNGLREKKVYFNCQVNRDVVFEDKGIDESKFQLKTIEFGQGKFDYQLAAAKSCITNPRGILKISMNGGKTAIASAVTKYLQVPTLFIVPGIDLLHQSRKMFARYLGMQIDDIGILGDKQYRFGDWITVAIPDSIYSRFGDDTTRKYLEETCQLVIADEAHTAGAETVYSVLDTCNAPRRVGLSGTPLDRTDGADLRLIAQTGEITYEIRNKLLIERGVSVPVTIELKPIEWPEIKSKNWKLVHNKTIIKNETLNADIVQSTIDLVNQGKQVFVLVKEVAHGKELTKRLQVEIAAQFLHGEEDSEARLEALDDFNSGTIRCMIGTKILYQGIDTPNIDAIVFADLGKSKINVLQALGRGLRQRPGKDRLLVRDYVNFCHKYVLEHSQVRIRTYKDEECFDLQVLK